LGNEEKRGQTGGAKTGTGVASLGKSLDAKEKVKGCQTKWRKKKKLILEFTFGGRKKSPHILYSNRKVKTVKGRMGQSTLRPKKAKP